jgi:hypothetical protein
MPRSRASIFEEPDIDVSGFTPKAAPDASAPPAKEVREVSEAARFRSREPAPVSAPPQAVPKRVQRRHRTGRNVQFNVKASQETIDVFYAITDREGWVLGETLEHALAALEQHLAKRRAGRPHDPRLGFSRGEK